MNPKQKVIEVDRKIIYGLSELYDFAQRINNEITVLDLAERIKNHWDIMRKPENRTPENLERFLELIQYILDLEDLLESFDDWYFLELDEQNFEIETEKGVLAQSIYGNCYNLALEIFDWVDEVEPQMLNRGGLPIRVNLLDEYTSKNNKIIKNSEVTFQWETNNDNELPELFNLMRDKYKLISKKTTYHQFEDIFTGKPISDITPIKWENKTVLLAYFLNKLRVENKIPFNTSLWAKGSKCFSGLNRKTLANAYQNSLSNKNPKNKELPKDHGIIDLLFE